MLGSKERILYASGEVLAKNGLDKVTIDEIARTASVSKATIYKYFSDKDEIISEYAMHIIGSDRDFWLDIIDGERSPENVLRSFGLTYINYISKPVTVHVFRVVVCLFDRIFEKNNFCYSLLPTGVLAALEAKFDAWRTHGEFDVADSGLLARQFLAMLRGPVYPAIMLDPAFSVDRNEAQRVVDQAIGVLLHGVSIDHKSDRE